MYKLKFLFILFCVASLAVSEDVQADNKKTSSRRTDFIDFTLTSTSFDKGGVIPKGLFYNGLTCNGENLSPQLSWKGAPEGTRSYVITMFDMDAPTGSGWWHWGVYNIPADVNSLEEGASKTSGNKMPFFAKEIFTDYGTTGYGGPACLAADEKPHRYVITVYALKAEFLGIDNASTATGAMLTATLRGDILAKAQITAVSGK